MASTPDWDEVARALGDRGWLARVIPATVLDEVRERVAQAICGSFEATLEHYLSEETAYELPREPAANSVIVGALRRPLTQARLTWHGEQVLIDVPPYYAGCRTLEAGFATTVSALLAPCGYRAAQCGPPLKTLAARAGLARFGYNNLAYVEGMGSYILLAACVSDAPPPAQTVWMEPQWLERCESCEACRRACPGGAIRKDRPLLHTERCLTLHNELPDPLPEWITPDMHHAAVGCVRCQRACPVNKQAGLLVAETQEFDERETQAILAGRPTGELPANLAAKVAGCGLDYDPPIVARNLAFLLDSTAHVPIPGRS